MAHYPPSLAPAGNIAPAPRRVRGLVGSDIAFETTRALYVWEWPPYPHYYIPRADVRAVLVAEGDAYATPQGDARRCVLRSGALERPNAARLIVASPLAQLRDTVRFTWSALDAWFEEDEEIFVHPRSPYARVDAVRCVRRIRIEVGGTPVAESASCVALFETGLPTRYYLDARDVDFRYLVPSPTRTECPYKGRTTGYWSVSVDGDVISDVGWTYAFPTPAVARIAGLVAFLNESVDIFIDGERQDRPTTHMSQPRPTAP